MKYLSCLVCIVILGCAAHYYLSQEIKYEPVVNVSVYISDEFSETEKADIIAGILLWEKKMQGLITWNYIQNKETANSYETSSIAQKFVIYEQVSPDDKIIIAYENKHCTTALGLYYGESSDELATIYLILERLQPRNKLVTISAHEFGHALGLDHVDNKNSIMSALYNRRTTTITKFDIREFCDQYDCSK